MSNAGNVSSPFADPEDLAILDGPDPAEGTNENEEQEILDELDSEDETPSEEDTSEDEPEDEPTEEDEEEKAEDESEDDLDARLGNFPNRPTYAQIKKYDPNFLKKFPGIRDLVFREEQYSKHFPTLEDAREAVEQLTNYKAVEQTITSGDPVEFLEVLENYDTQTAESFVDSFLPGLSRNKPELFQRVTKPLLKHMLQAMYKKYEHASEGVGLNRKNAVMHMHEELFGDLDISKKLNVPSKAEPQKDPKYEQEKQEFYSKKETEFRSTTRSQTKAGLEAHLAKQIDPQKALSDYDRRNITRDVLDELDKVLTSDQQHMALMGSLWNRAKKSGWSSEFLDRISTAYLSRAKMVLPDIVRKARSEALQARKSKASRSNSSPVRRTAPSPSSRPDGRKVKEDEIDWNRSSDLDIINDTPKRRRT